MRLRNCRSQSNGLATGELEDGCATVETAACVVFAAFPQTDPHRMQKFKRFELVFAPQEILTPGNHF